MTDDVNLWTQPEWAERYLERQDDLPHRREGYSALGEHLPNDRRRVLDLGTGDGHTLGFVLGQDPLARGVGVDFSAVMLERARARFANDDRVEIIEHNIDEPLPAALGRFDLVVSSFAIHHCADARKRDLYGEIFSLLEPGGRFLNLEHVASPTAALHQEFLTAIGISPGEDDPSNKLASVGLQLGWLDAIGFVDVDCHWKWRELALLAGVKPG